MSDDWCNDYLSFLKILRFNLRDFNNKDKEERTRYLEKLKSVIEEIESNKTNSQTIMPKDLYIRTIEYQVTFIEKIVSLPDRWGAVYYDHGSSRRKIN